MLKWNAKMAANFAHDAKRGIDADVWAWWDGWRWVVSTTNGGKTLARGVCETREAAIAAAEEACKSK